MARKVHVQLIDDLSGENADGTVRFSVDGADYEIDLTADHATELRGVLEKYIAHARRLRGTPDRRGTRTAPTGREETQRIRDWAKAHGYNPSARGRISQDIKQAYDAAQA
ncbi:histone-like nucleoid-structuring protein Lsr2 [Pseudarthrobacter albicanus]|uniref:histone-like nucleoid-structuring protein Lsr2 n=1 Tax=Pseudarthrobacter albicanus TaxID=2823873 RepID=UPI001BAB7066|nr:Lsr2 family protein [Pseudarthrobacter albicanus]